MSLKERFKSKFLTSPDGKLKLIMLISGLLILVAALTVGAFAFTMRSSFCGSCHEMNPEYKTWQASAHGQIACTDCHIEPGVINLLKDKINALGQVYQHVTHTYASPIEYPYDKHTIPNEVCLKCHSANRQYSPSGDIIIPHNKHIAAGVLCIDCHKGVTHGLIAERGISKNSTIPFDQWTDQTGAQQMVPQFDNPRMDTCITCHTKRGVSVNCTTCHSAVGVPDSHKNADQWKTNHGIAAEKNINTCSTCHSYGFVQGTDYSHFTVAQYVRENTFCLSCHTQRPASHGDKSDESWLSAHGNAEKTKGIGNCLACHSLSPQAQSSANSVAATSSPQQPSGEINRSTTDKKKEDMVNTVYCTTCHGSKFGK